MPAQHPAEPSPSPSLEHVVEIHGLEHVAVDPLMPADARRLALDAVLEAFAAAGVTGFVIDDALATGTVVGVLPEQRRRALRALAAALPGPGAAFYEVYEGSLPQLPVAASSAALEDVPNRCPAVVVGRLWSLAGGALTYGLDYGCRVEFWHVIEEGPGAAAGGPGEAGQMLAPAFRAPRVGATHRDLFTPATVTVAGIERPTVAVFDRTFVDEVRFPIDAVYTWVDGDDPVWLERMQRARATDEGVAYHPQAQGANRFASRDELRYSLRSLEMYAPWVRHVYVVTDGQTPSWLADEHPGLSIVDHRDIYADPAVLPVFNSSAIITQLHHIAGLAEHYLYLNDDMFFGTDARPEDFWFASGIAKVFPSRVARAFAPAGEQAAPHFNISRNIRRVLEEQLGVSMSWAIKHTPYPQLRSVNAEMEQRFADVLGATAAHRFRHHDDIAQDQLFHYYAQAVGRAVPAEIGYEYVNVGDAAAVVKLRRMLAGRDATVFCLNDAPDEASSAIPPEQVTDFLQAYFPMPSRWERAAP